MPPSPTVTNGGGTASGRVVVVGAVVVEVVPTVVVVVGAPVVVVRDATVVEGVPAGSPPHPTSRVTSRTRAARRGITDASYRRVEEIPAGWYDSRLPSPRRQPTMANIRSQQKRNRQNEVRRMRNKAVNSELKTRAKRVETAVASGDVEAADEALRVAQRKLDVAASRRTLHPKTAARRKSRLAARVNRLRGS